MGPTITNGGKFYRVFALLGIAISCGYAQTLPVSGSCSVTAVPSQTRAEGITERIGDIILQCAGSNPGTLLSGNFSVALPVSITNRIDANNQTTDVVLSVDYGSGFVPTAIPGQILNNILTFSGISFTIPPSGNLNLKISNIRAAVSQFGVSGPRGILASLSFSTTSSILVNQAQVTVAFAQPGLLATLSDRGTINCAGSPLPSTLNLVNLFSAGTAFASTRVAEGFGSSFQPRGAGEDTGTRFLVKYSGFPANAHIYLPDLVAGSDAAAPTAGGDLGVPQQAGQYLPGSHTLLLARVLLADSNGVGGYFAAGPTGSGPVALNSVSEVPLTNGSGSAVYEVLDSNPNLLETAQFPTFIGLPEVTAPAVAQESISFAPVSSTLSASANAPVPRFTAATPASDCSLLNDCNASYYPHLSVVANPIQLAAIAGGAMTSPPGYIPINNTGGGVMPWTAAVTYTDGSGWLTLDYTSGQNDGSVRTWAKPQGLAAGTYHAAVTITASGLAGSATVPVTLTIQPAQPPVAIPPPVAVPAVTVSQVINAATFQVTPLVPGSVGTLMGSNLAGGTVSVSLD